MNESKNVDDPRSTLQHPTILVSVIIPAYNEERLIAFAIRSVFRSSFPLVSDGRVEVIVVDNASTDNTGREAEEAGAKIISEALRQIARARNAGARASLGKYLIFLDADSEMHPGHLQHVVDLLGSGTVIGGGAVISMDTSWDYRLFVGLWNCISIVGRLAAGSFLFCDRESFERVGGFDERLYAGEELSLSRRLKRLGRSTGRKFVVLSDLPVKTSNRKIVDHSRWEIYRGLLKLALRGVRGLRDQRACAYWYPQTRR